MRIAGLAAGLLAGCAAAADAADAAGPAPGKLLVASRGLSDPNFAHTVVLLIDHGPGGAMGLVINRPSTQTLGHAVPRIEPRRAADPLYTGGPVERNELLLLIRSAGAPEGAREVLSNVWVSNSPKLLAEIAADTSGERSFRLFAGYAGWGPGQLEDEIEAGGWHVVEGSGAAVFDARPFELWRKLVPPAPTDIARGRLAALEEALHR